MIRLEDKEKMESSKDSNLVIESKLLLPYTFRHGWEAIPIKVRLCSWNVQGSNQFKFTKRVRTLFKVLKYYKNDYVCLQGVTQKLLNKFTESQWVKSNYFISFVDNPHKGETNFILSKNKPMDLIYFNTEEMNAIIANYGYVIIINVRISPDSTEKDKSIFFDKLIDHCKIINQKYTCQLPITICGDFGSDLNDNKNIVEKFDDIWEELRPGDPGYIIDPETNKTIIYKNENINQTRNCGILKNGTGIVPLRTFHIGNKTKFTIMKHEFKDKFKREPYKCKKNQKKLRWNISNMYGVAVDFKFLY